MIIVDHIYARLSFNKSKSYAFSVGICRIIIMLYSQHTQNVVLERATLF